MRQTKERGELVMGKEKCEKIELKNIATCELVKELKEREGVTVEQAEPYNIKNIEVNGPAIVLIITD